MIAKTHTWLRSVWPNVWQHLAELFARPRVSVFMMRLATRVDPPLMRLSGGRLRLSFVIPVLLLHCTGARTGKPRTLPLLYVPGPCSAAAEDGSGGPERLLLIASNAGQDRHPAWYFNLLAEPQVGCVIDGIKRKYIAKLLTQEARSAAFHRASLIYPGYVRYAQRCEREIGVFELEIRDPVPS